MHTDLMLTRSDSGLGAWIRRVGDAVDRWGTARVLLTIVVAFHLGTAVAFAVLPPNLLTSPSLEILNTIPLNVWGPLYGAVGIMALLDLLLPESRSAHRTRHALSVALWVSAIALGTFWLVGLTLPLLPQFGALGNALGPIVWGLVILPLLVYTAWITSRGENSGCGPDC